MRRFLAVLFVLLLIPLAVNAQGICIACTNPQPDQLFDFVPLDANVYVSSNDGVYTSTGYSFLRVTGSISITMLGNKCIKGIRVSYRRVTNAGNNWDSFWNSIDGQTYTIGPVGEYTNTNILADFIFSSASYTNTLGITKVSGGARWYIEYIQLLTCDLVTATPSISPTPTDTPTPTPQPTREQIPIGETENGLVPVGTIISYSGPEPDPDTAWLDGWLLCDGSAVSRTDYWRLFEVIGITYGNGDGSTTFNLPDLRGRTIIGTGQGSGLTLRSLATPVGAESHALTVNELPSHNHTVLAFTTALPLVLQTYLGTPPPVTLMYYPQATLTGNTGGGQPHNNMQPSIALHYLIWSGTQLLVFGDGMYPTWTPPPPIDVYSTVELGGLGQNVAFTYQITAGDFMVSILLLIGIGLLVIQMAFRLWGERRNG